MKRLFSIMLTLTLVLPLFSQAKIEFDKNVHNYGTFSESQPIQKCVFTFTNMFHGKLSLEAYCSR